MRSNEGKDTSFMGKIANSGTHSCGLAVFTWGQELMNGPLEAGARRSFRCRAISSAGADSMRPVQAAVASREFTC